MENQQGRPVNFDLVIDEYQIELSNTKHDNIMLKAYVRQLEDEIAQLKSKNEEK